MNIGKMARAISGVVLCTLIAKILGFLRELVLSYYFGATGISDAYLISQTIPGTIFQVVGTGLTTCFIPIFYKVLNRDGKEASNRFTNTIITIVLSFSTAAIFCIWLFTPQIVHLFAMGFDGETLKYAKQFTRIGVLSLYFSTFIYVYNSYLQANNIFTPTAFAAIPNSIAIIVSIILGAVCDIWLLPVGSTLAVGIQLLFILYPINKLQYHFHISFDWQRPDVRDFFALLAPVVFGVSVNEINVLVDRTIASNVAVGGISALTYANSLIMLIQGSIVQPIATVCYPKITHCVSNGNDKAAENIMNQTFKYLFAILIPLTFIFMIYQYQIIDVLFGHGKFSIKAVEMTGKVLFFYSLGIVFVGVREIMSRFYYAHANTKIPVRNATIGVGINILFNMIFSRFIGLSGLALATSFSACVTSILLFVDCNKFLKCNRPSLDLRDLMKVLLASTASIVFPSFFFLTLQIPSILKLGSALILGTIIYFIIGIVLKIKLFEFITVLGPFGKK